MSGNSRQGINKADNWRKELDLGNVQPKLKNKTENKFQT
jgi:hypothetical protein